MNSIVNNPNERRSFRVFSDAPCYLCGAPAHHSHHLISGTANRRNSEREGLFVPLCAQCHSRVHADPQLMQLMRTIGQLAFMQDAFWRMSALHIRGAIDPFEAYAFDDATSEFRAIFGKSFL